MATPEPPFVPLQYCEKWLAWSQDGLRIVGTGDTIEEAQAAALAAGEEQPILEWVPPSDELLVGSTP